MRTNIFKKNISKKTIFGKNVLHLTRWAADAYQAIREAHHEQYPELDCADDTVVRVHGKEWYATKNYCHLNVTHYYKVRDLLDALHVSYTLGNDAPRGGKSGDFIEFNYKDFYGSMLTAIFSERSEN